MSGFDQALKNTIRERDEHRCARCGRHVPPGKGSVHHRLPRGRGGPDIPANLLLLCGHATEPDTCHYFAESFRLSAYAVGLLLRTGEDPRTTPMRRMNGTWWQPGAKWEPAAAPEAVTT